MNFEVRYLELTTECTVQLHAPGWLDYKVTRNRTRWYSGGHNHDHVKLLIPLCNLQASRPYYDYEYFANTILLFRGCRHDGCSEAKLADNSLRAVDPVRSSFQEMTVNTEFLRLECSN